MTVRELIAALSECDMDREVVIANDDGDELPIVSIEQSAVEAPHVVALFVS